MIETSSLVYVDLFQRQTWAASPVPVRALAASTAMCATFARPHTYADASLLAYDLERLFGTASDRSVALAYLQSQGIGVLDLQAFVDRGDMAALSTELRAQSTCGLAHLVLLRDGSRLTDASGKLLHPYMESPTPHTLVRVGASETPGLDCYVDSGASAFARPTPIAWQSMVDAGIVAVLGVLPDGVPVPPADWTYAEVDHYGQVTLHTWPVPVPPPAPAPVFDPSPVLAALSEAHAPLASAQDALASWQTQPFSALPSLIESVAQQLQQVSSAHTSIEAAVSPSSSNGDGQE